MAVYSTTNKITYTITSGVTDYTFNFTALLPTDIKVYVYDSQNNKTALVYNVDYSVTLGSTSGYISLITSQTAGNKLLIYREMDLTQTTKYTEGDPFPAKLHEDALDKLTMIDQQISEIASRTVKLDEISTANATIPVPIGGYVLGYDQASDSFKWVDMRLESQLPAKTPLKYLGTDSNNNLAWLSLQLSSNVIYETSEDPTNIYDEAHGYKVGDIVINGVKIFMCNDNTNNNAEWQSLITTIGAPTIGLPANVNENSTTTITINDYVSDAAYSITADKGSISNVTGGTFDYIAPDITDGQDTTDTIHISYKLATIQSLTGNYTLNVLHLTITADGQISNADFQTNENYNDGFTY